MAITIGVQSTEIHLLNQNNTSGMGSSVTTFQISVEMLDCARNVDVTSSSTFTLLSGNSVTLAPGGLISTTQQSGTSYIRVSHSNVNGTARLTVRIVVHDNFMATGSDFQISKGDSTISVHKSRTATENSLIVYYQPTIYIEFSDGEIADITAHPYLEYTEVLGGVNIPETHPDSIISFNLFAQPNTRNPYTGRFFCKDNNIVASSTTYDRQLKIGLIGINSGFTHNTVACNVHLQPYLDVPRPILTKLNENYTKQSAQLIRILILGDGFTASQRPLFDKHCTRILDDLRSTPPYNLLADSIEVWCAFTPSRNAGATLPSYIYIAPQNPQNQNDPREVTLLPGDIAYLPMNSMIQDLLLLQGPSNTANQGNAGTYFDNHRLQYNYPANLRTQFVATYARTERMYVINNQDTFYSATLGKGRFSEAHSDPTKDELVNDFWEQNIDHYLFGFDKRKTIVEQISPTITKYGGAYDYVNIIIGSMTSAAQDNSISGSIWLVDTNTESTISRRAFAAMLINHPLNSGSNSRNGIFSTTLLDLRSISGVVDTSNRHYVEGYIGTDQANWQSKAPHSAFASTFLHEFTHSFNIGDEYSDTRGGNYVKLNPSLPDYTARVRAANVDSLTRVTRSGTISPFDVKWNWYRVDRSALVIDQIVHTLTDNPTQATDNVITLKVDDLNATQWQLVKDEQQPVYIRTIDFPNNENNFVTIGDELTGSMSIDSIDSGTSTIKLKFSGNALLAKERLSFFGTSSVLFTRKRGLCTIKSVQLSSEPGAGGSGFAKRGSSSKNKKLVLDIDSNIKTSNGRSAKISVQLEIDSNGVCVNAYLLPGDESAIFDSASSRFIEDNANWPKKWFTKPFSYPKFTIQFNYLDTGLSHIHITNHGSGYTSAPTVQLSPNLNNVQFDVNLSEASSSIQPGPSALSEDFYFPLYLKAIDKRNIGEAFKGRNLTAVVVALTGSDESTGGIKEIRITNPGNGFYSINDNDTEIKVFNENGDVVTNSNATFSFNAARYHKYRTDRTEEGLRDETDPDARSGEYVPTSPPSGTLVYQRFITVKTAGNGYFLPRMPFFVRLVHNERFTSTNAEKEDGLGLMYITGGMFASMEILFGGSLWTTGESITLSYIDVNRGVPMQYFQNELKQYSLSDWNANGHKVGYSPDHQLPVLIVGSTGTNGTITAVHLTPSHIVGRNLRYPVGKLTILSCLPTLTYNNYVAGTLGKYLPIYQFPVTPVQPARRLFRIFVEKVNESNATSRVHKAFGGKPTVAMPANGLGVSSFLATASANTSEIIIVQGRGIKSIDFKYLNGVKQNGSGYLNQQVTVSISGRQLQEGEDAKAVAEFSNYPRVIDGNIMDYMIKNNSPLVGFIPQATDDISYNSLARPIISNALTAINSGRTTGEVEIDLNSSIDGLIAIYEGGARLPKESYRPSFNSIMRHQDGTLKALFINFATMYYIVNFIDPTKLGELDNKEYAKSITYKIK